MSVAVVPITLCVLGTVSTGIYFWGRDLHRFTQWIAAYVGLFVTQLAIYVLACYVVQRWPDRSSRTAKLVSIALVIFFAAVCRGVLVPQRPYLSSDVYRYVWDGRVQTAGINPYRYVPEAAELKGLRDDKIFPNVNREDRDWLSPYPPVAQMVFFAVSRVWPMSVTAVKAAMSSFDLMTVLVLMLTLARSGLDPLKAIIFAWHPLVIFESAHSGHIDAVYVLFLALALFAWSYSRNVLTGAGLALATLVKFYPVLLLPLFLAPSLGRSNTSLGGGGNGEEHSPSSFFSRLNHKKSLVMLVAFAATVILCYAPYWSAGNNLFAFVRGYVEEEGFVNTGTRYFLLDAIRKLVWIPTNVFLIVAAAGFVAVAAWWLLRVKQDAVDVARGALAMIGTYLLLTTPRYAWYYVWLLPFLCFVPRASWLYLASASVLLYLVWYTPLIYPEVPLWLGSSIYFPTLALLVWETFLKRRRTLTDGMT
jgi:hypothetical protein